MRRFLCFPCISRSAAARRLSGWLALVLTCMAVAVPSAVAVPYTLSGTEIRPLPRSGNGREYTLYVGLPSSYASSPNRRYPVVYITDGYWDFTLLTWETGNLVVDGLIPE